ncbi:hypothetical protein [Phaeobacter sp. 11ANDIMAR09]|uniref:hypothetical protein n=1 Tax=Phaeobacter sp. 11ANDIMAR09 TaxID=1225647 RepID=UPI0006C88F3A|nr:hypothetical protein [Phaeobacter sp. 11ANDIMAR09]KPD12640.1 hypothetical protein AN476_08680 [Phaeobacter sp. 11ANDIMAR09]
MLVDVLVFGGIYDCTKRELKIEYLRKSLHLALAQFSELTGIPFPVIPRLDLHDDVDFWALAEREEGGLKIHVGGGVLPAITTLWNDALSESNFILGVHSPLLVEKTDAVQMSLGWLMLHEMQHFVLGHFDIVGRTFLSETARGKRLALTSRGVSKTSIFDDLDATIKPMVEPCLELQADHDAIDLVLDAYSTDEWPSLRARIAAIAAMIMLIEREDAKLVEAHSSHPKAATRIFQLLGHVTEMPLILAQRKAVLNGAANVDPNDIPSNEEQSAFNREVVIPSFFDVVNLARVAGADSICNDLGEASDFFCDVGTAKMGNVSAFKGLRTSGAKQWADLVVVNERIKELFAQDGLVI